MGREVFVHPKYDGNHESGFDIAIIRLKVIENNVDYNPKEPRDDRLMTYQAIGYWPLGYYDIDVRGK